MAQISIIAGINRTQQYYPGNASWGVDIYADDGGIFYIEKGFSMTGGLERIEIIGYDNNILTVNRLINGTQERIRVLSYKPSANPAVGFLNSAPDPTIADSQPPLSEFDSQWGCADWQLWHKANVKKYDLDTANRKFTYSFNQLFSANSAYLFCGYNCAWLQYFSDAGVDVSNMINRLECNIVSTVDNTGGVLNNTTGAINNVASMLKWVLPLSVFIGGAWAIDRFVYPIFPKRASVSGFRKRRKKK